MKIQMLNGTIENIRMMQFGAEKNWNELRSDVKSIMPRILDKEQHADRMCIRAQCVTAVDLCVFFFSSTYLHFARTLSK